MDLAAAALDYAARGWPVFPLVARDKRPATTNGLHDATTDPDRITAWWTRHPGANIGLRTGVAFDVCDLDNDQALDELDAAAPPDAGTIEGPIVATGKGVHIYVGVTGAGNRAGFLPGIDWRGTGGYVVAPPSIHPSGATYEWGAGYGPDHPIAPCPTWLAGLAARRSTRPVTPVAPRRQMTGSRTKWAQTALDAECGRVALAAEGTRNETLNAAAFNLGQIVGSGNLDAGDVTTQLVAAATRAGLSQNEAEATIRSGLQSGVLTPRGAA